MPQDEERAGASPTAAEQLPDYETKSETVRQARAAIAVGLACTITCFTLSVWIFSTDGLVHPAHDLGEAEAEVISFAANIVVTACSDALGYVHGTSLRWALYREGRLEYNTNFRLFRSARSSAPNRWPMNLLAVASLVLCYACTSVLLCRDLRADGFGVNAVALFGLAMGLAGQSITAIACMWGIRRDVPTWSSNSLNNTLASLRGPPGLRHRPGRCMLSVFERDGRPTPARPRAAQRSLWGLRSTRWIVIFIWALSGLAYIWFGICLAIPTSMFSNEEFNFSWSDESTAHAVYFGMDQATNTPADPIYFPEPVHFVLAVLFLCLVQGFQTLALHCVELLVNMRRDEKTWRAAGTEHGATIGTAPLWAALTTWETDTLFIIKAGFHWLLGQSLVPYFQLELDPGYFEFHMSYSRLLVLALFTTLLGIFTTWLAASKVSGPQPAAWGHLQTLADLVDDWEMPQGRLWWGDKGVGRSGTRHAGTAGSRDIVSSMIYIDGKYA